MLVVAAIMFYILELIMKIVPNYPTVQESGKKIGCQEVLGCGLLLH
jgi:hypothetical protein